MSASRVHVVGGSIAGLGMALALERRGVPVTVHEAGDPSDGLDEGARREPRRATPQAAHSHAFVARCHALLAEEAPDVLDDLAEAGVESIALGDALPPTVPAHARHPDIDDLVVLAARRTTFEHVLRRAARRRAGITIRHGARVSGLVTSQVDGVVAVGGLLTDDGPDDASLVVDASGRRSPQRDWLADAGATFTSTDVDCGITYVSRFYRRRDRAARPPLNRGYTAGASFDRYSCLVFPGDDGSFSITFGILPEDRELRGLLTGSAFDAAVSAIESLAHWVRPDFAEPISEPRMMAGLRNTLHRPWHDGRPTVLGWTAVGDAAATTNPAHSRGCTLALVHAVAAADAFAAHGDDRHALAVEFEAIRDTEQRPWVEDSVDQDRSRLSRWRDDVDDPGPAPGTVSNGEAYGASLHDAYVWRRFSRLQQLLEPPSVVLGDRQVVARVRAVQASGRRSPAAAAPDHDEMAALVAAHA